MIVLHNSNKILQSPCHFFYQYQCTLDGLLLSKRLLTDQTLAKIVLVDCQMTVGKILFVA